MYTIMNNAHARWHSCSLVLGGTLNAFGLTPAAARAPGGDPPCTRSRRSHRSRGDIRLQEIVSNLNADGARKASGASQSIPKPSGDKGTRGGVLAPIAFAFPLPLTVLVADNFIGDHERWCSSLMMRRSGR